MSSITIAFVINGEKAECILRPRQLLTEVIRDDLRLTGTHVGCGTGQCGSCTVLIDGEPVRACLMLAVQADGTEVETIESVGTRADLHPIQIAFRKHHALQCGFCTPGFIMSAVALFRGINCPSSSQIDEMIQGHLCRCTGYRNIVEAIHSLAEAKEV